MDKVQVNGNGIVGAGSTSSFNHYEHNGRILRSSLKTSMQMSSSTSTVNNAIVSNGYSYEHLASKSAIYESSDDSVDLIEFNKSLRILDEDLEDDEKPDPNLLYKVKNVLNFTGRSILNVVCLPVYWILVQNFVFEKWLLHRRHRPKELGPSTYRSWPARQPIAGSISKAIIGRDEQTITIPDQGGSDGRSKGWILLFALLLTGGLLASWMNSDDLLGQTMQTASWDDLTMNSAPPIIPKPHKGAPDIPLSPEPEPPFESVIPPMSPVIFVKPEPVVDDPIEPELPPPPPPPVDPPLVVESPPIPIPIPQVLPPVTPEVACINCPPTNNIDVDALKKELTEHFTAVIKEQCVNKCDCPPAGPPVTPPVGTANMDDIDRKIQMAIRKYDADKTGLPDLALEPSGGSVVSTRCTKHSQNKNSIVSFLGIPLWSPPNNPRTVIQPGLVPGECWSFEGSIGYIVIKLAGPSHIEGFSLEHIPKSVSPHGHIESAPKNFQVVGMMDYNDQKTEHTFGDYVYEDKDEPLQYFKVQNQAEQAYPYIELKIGSNHGSVEFTCVYRFRVHGHF